MGDPFSMPSFLGVKSRILDTFRQPEKFSGETIVPENKWPWYTCLFFIVVLQRLANE